MIHLDKNPAWLRRAAILTALQTALLLSACGGDSSNSPAVTPTPTPTPAPSTGQTSFAPIDTNNRAEVVARFNDSYLPLKATTFSWTGNVNTCTPGDTPLTYKNAEVRLVNYFRAMASLPSSVALDLTQAAKAQQAALMMDANSALNHAPPTSWNCYTVDGAASAGLSNLALSSGALNTGIGGPSLYMTDDQVTSLGHRRWMLYSRLATVGPGDTPHASALQILNTDGPVYTPVKGIPWPPAGFVPQDDGLALPRLQWSFSYPAADFSGATVTMTNDANASVALINVAVLDAGYGDNTLGWFIDSNASNWNRYPLDTRLNIAVNNVKVNGVATNFTYSVTFIKP